MDQSSDDISIRLTRAQALVLFEWLATHTGDDAIGVVPFQDPAERDVLWALEGKLEKLLPEPLAPDYKHRVEAARRHDCWGGSATARTLKSWNPLISWLRHIVALQSAA